MNQRKQSFTWLLTITLLVIGGYAYYQAQVRQTDTLARITALDACLVAANKQQAQAVQISMASISYYVVENHRQARDLWVQHQAQRIQANTQALVDTLGSLRQRWPASGTPAALMRLAVQFRQYTDTLNVVDAIPSSPPPPGWPVIDQAAVTGLQHLAAPVAVAALTRLENQVWHLATETLYYQASKVGRIWDGFLRIGAYAVPVSKTVAPGRQYEARLMLSEAASGLKQRMLTNGQKILIDSRTNHGIITFRVPPANPGQPDTVRTQWQGQILTNSNGIDTARQLVVPYFIVKHW